jgi:hypothetical protein
MAEKTVVPARALETAESFWTAAPDEAADAPSEPAVKPGIKAVIVAALKTAGLLKK